MLLDRSRGGSRSGCRGLAGHWVGLLHSRGGVGGHGCCASCGRGERGVVTRPGDRGDDNLAVDRLDQHLTPALAIRGGHIASILSRGPLLGFGGSSSRGLRRHLRLRSHWIAWPHAGKHARSLSSGHRRLLTPHLRLDWRLLDHWRRNVVA